MLKLDSTGKLLERDADLALIILDEAVSLRLTPTALASTELQAHERVVVVGHGYDKNVTGVRGQRRFQDYKVLKSLEPGQLITFEQPMRGVYKGDSGGPCLRETAQGDELVGISARGLGEEAACTSLGPHHAWVVDAIARTSQEEHRRPPESP
jgi:hypothetical protein